MPQALIDDPYGVPLLFDTCIRYAGSDVLVTAGGEEGCGAIICDRGGHHLRN